MVCVEVGTQLKDAYLCETKSIWYFLVAYISMQTFDEGECLSEGVMTHIFMHFSYQFLDPFHMVVDSRLPQLSSECISLCLFQSWIRQPEISSECFRLDVSWGVEERIGGVTFEKRRVVSLGSRRKSGASGRGSRDGRNVVRVEDAKAPHFIIIIIVHLSLREV